MTEKSESFEVYPMKGHSRGEWYGTLDDVADTPESAEYWAVFGVTHRGNRHCLGEFSSEALAWAAVKGLQRFRPDRTAHRKSDRRRAAVRQLKWDSESRRIVQLEVSRDENDPSMLELIVHCNDGTVWHRGIGVGRDRSFADDVWSEITLEGIDP